MAEPSPYEKEMFKDMKAVELDPHSYTLAEIRANLNMSDRQARDLVKRKMESGEWERVSKWINNRRSMSFRPVKSKSPKKRTG